MGDAHNGISHHGLGEVYGLPGRLVGVDVNIKIRVGVDSFEQYTMGGLNL